MFHIMYKTFNRMCFLKMYHQRTPCRSIKRNISQYTWLKASKVLAWAFKGSNTRFCISITLKHIQAQILQKLRHCLSLCWASILQNFKAFIPKFTKNTHNVQIAPSHKHSIGIFEAQKINFAKHNEAHKNLPNAYKKNVYFKSIKWY